MAEFYRNTSSQDVPTREQIARRAYEIYEQRGRENGRDMEDWLAAEKELRNQNLTRSQPTSLAVQASSATGSRRKQAKSKAASASPSAKSFDSAESLDNHRTQ